MKLNEVGSIFRRCFASAQLLMLASCVANPQQGGAVQPPTPVLAPWNPTLHLADIALSRGAPSIALQASDELLVNDPRNVKIIIRRALALAALGRLGEAITSFETALEIDPMNTKALVGLGRLRLLQDPAAAEALFLRVTALNPRDSISLSNLGVARDLQGKHAAAQEAYRNALEVTPTSVAVQANLGLSMALSGDASAAVRLLQPLAAAPDAAPRVRHNLALALAISGHKSEASAVLGHDLSSVQVRDALDGFEALRP